VVEKGCQTSRQRCIDGGSIARGSRDHAEVIGTEGALHSDERRIAITLNDVAKQAATLTVACDRCGSAGRYKVETLIARHAPYFGIPGLLALLSADRPIGRFSTGKCQVLRCIPVGGAHREIQRRSPSRQPGRR
jgi:hypothetical protein